MRGPCPAATAVLLAAGLAAGAAAAPKPAAPASDLSFCRPPFVPPLIIQDLLAWESDGGDQVVAINLTESNGSNRYSGEIRTGVGERAPKHPTVSTTVRRGEGDQQYDELIGYEYIGATTSGVHVLATWQYGSGTMVANRLLLVTIEEDRGITEVPEPTEGGLGNLNGALRLTRPRLLIRKLGELVLGDRWDGELRVEGNKILVGRDQGHFSGGAGDGSPYNRRDIVLELEDKAARPTVLKPCP